MTKAALRRLLDHLRRMPDPTPAEALAEFRRLVELAPKAKRAWQGMN